MNLVITHDILIYVYGIVVSPLPFFPFGEKKRKRDRKKEKKKKKEREEVCEELSRFLRLKTSISDELVHPVSRAQKAHRFNRTGSNWSFVALATGICVQRAELAGPLTAGGKARPRQCIAIGIVAE